jgi:hypothetical protein
VDLYVKEYASGVSAGMVCVGVIVVVDVVGYVAVFDLRMCTMLCLVDYPCVCMLVHVF